MDFIVSTDHNTSASHGVWGPLAGEDLLILTGEEVTTPNGHYLALGMTPGEWVDWRYRARDSHFDEFASQIHSSGGLVVPAPLLPVRRLPVEVRLRARRRGRGVERAMDG